MASEFHWQGINRFGQKQRGKCLAPSRMVLEQQLLHKGYRQIHIRRNFVLATKPKTETITQTLNQLSLLLNAAIPLKTALEMMVKNCQHIQLYHWLNQLIQQLENGFAFSAAVEKLGKYLTPQEIQLIKMGETSGQLPALFRKMVEARAKSENLHKKVKKILFYPVVVLSISLVLSLALLLFIVPQFAELYSIKSASLPFITEVLFILSTFLTEKIASIGFFILFLLLCHYIFRNVLKIKRHFYSYFRLFLLGKIPIFNQIIIQSRIIFFCQHCALMLQAQIRLDRILTGFIQQKSDPILAKEAQLILQLLQQGYPFNEGLNPSIWGQEVIQMIAIGEQSGKLSEMLLHISEIYQQRLDDQIEMLSQLLEPLLMLLMGIIVGTILIGLYLPIFELGTLVK